MSSAAYFRAHVVLAMVKYRITRVSSFPSNWLDYCISDKKLWYLLRMDNWIGGGIGSWNFLYMYYFSMLYANRPKTIHSDSVQQF
jgi:hypothetical protein